MTIPGVGPITICDTLVGSVSFPDGVSNCQSCGPGVKDKSQKLMKVVLPEKEGWGFGMTRTQWLIDMYNKVTNAHRMTFWPFISTHFLPDPHMQVPSTPTYVHKSGEWYMYA